MATDEAGMRLARRDDLEEATALDLAEAVAARYGWTCARSAPDRLSLQVEAQWRSYALTLAWSGREQMLRLLCTFEMEPPAGKLPQLHEILNRINDSIWDGTFTWWPEPRLMVFRYALLLDGDQSASPEQIDRMLLAAVGNAERYYPALQLVTWGDRPPEEAMRAAIGAVAGYA